MEDLISIIVPVYNVGKYLEKCLESIKNQTYKNIEVILINDGSTDNSEEICNEYCKKYKEFVLYNKKNGGLSSARNYGLDRITGDYIVFIDSDDVISTDYITDLYNCIKNNNCDISMCGYKRFYEQIPNIQNSDNVEILSSKETLKKILYQENQEIFSVSSWNKMYKKEVFDNIRFPENRINEDVAVLKDVFNKCKNIGCIFNYNYYYRYNNQSITGKAFSPKKMDAIFFTEKLIENYKNTDLELAAINLFFRRNVEMISEIGKNKEYVKYKKDMIKNIKLYRKTILKDKNSKKSTKLAAIGSYLSIKIVVAVRKLMKKRN